MALSKIPTHMYFDPTAAKLPAGSVIKLFFDEPNDTSQSNSNGTVLELTSGGHRPSFTRVLGSTESQLLFDGGFAIYGDLDNENLILEGVMAAQKDFNIKSTPSFVINGNLVEGNKNIKEFRQIIDKILSE